MAHMATGERTTSDGTKCAGCGRAYRDDYAGRVPPGWDESPDGILRCPDCMHRHVMAQAECAECERLCDDYEALRHDPHGNDHLQASQALAFLSAHRATHREVA